MKLYKYIKFSSQENIFSELFIFDDDSELPDRTAPKYVKDKNKKFKFESEVISSRKNIYHTISQLLSLIIVF